MGARYSPSHHFRVVAVVTVGFDGVVDSDVVVKCKGLGCEQVGGGVYVGSGQR